MAVTHDGVDDVSNTADSAQTFVQVRTQLSVLGESGTS